MTFESLKCYMEGRKAKKKMDLPKFEPGTSSIAGSCERKLMISVASTIISYRLFKKYPWLIFLGLQITLNQYAFSRPRVPKALVYCGQGLRYQD